MKRCVPHHLQKRVETLCIVPYFDYHQALGNKKYVSEK